MLTQKWFMLFFACLLIIAPKLSLINPNGVEATQGTQSVKFIRLWGSCANAVMVKVANVEAHGMMLAPISFAIHGNIRD
ncbi:hypothetical protein E2542_SST29544 [Spatholobus suberectus]|nr:hypothetical protein E2542_SST29544 [Spatholobus suberectus]